MELVALIQPSLVKLNDAVEESKLFFSATVPFDEKATALLQEEHGAAIAQSFLTAIQAEDSLNPDSAKAMIGSITKELGIKKGIVMRSLRACLTGSLQGPDLMQAWMLFNQRGWDVKRLEQALEVAQAD